MAIFISYRGSEAWHRNYVIGQCAKCHSRVQLRESECRRAKSSSIDIIEYIKMSPPHIIEIWPAYGKHIWQKKYVCERNQAGKQKCRARAAWQKAAACTGGHGENARACRGSWLALRRRRVLRPFTKGLPTCMSGRRLASGGVVGMKALAARVSHRCHRRNQ